MQKVAFFQPTFVNQKIQKQLMRCKNLFQLTCVEHCAMLLDNQLSEEASHLGRGNMYTRHYEICKIHIHSSKPKPICLQCLQFLIILNPQPHISPPFESKQRHLKFGWIFRADVDCSPVTDGTMVETAMTRKS